MKTILLLIKKDLILFSNDKVALGLTFIVPAVLIFLFGSIFSGGGSNISGIPIIFLDQSGLPIGKKIQTVLDTTKTFKVLKSYKDETQQEKQFDSVSAKQFVKTGKATAALILPPQSDTSAAGLDIRLLYDPKNEIEMSIVEGMIQQTVMSQIPELLGSFNKRTIDKKMGKGNGDKFNRELSETIGKYFNAAPDEVLSTITGQSDSSSNDAVAQNLFSSIIRFDKEQVVGKEINNPGATRSVGGWAMMFLLFSLSAASLSLMEEQKNGTMMRLLTTPIDRVHILSAKYLYNTLIGFIQLLVLFVCGVLFFAIDIVSNLSNLLLMIIFSAYAATAFGMGIASFAKTQAQANGIATFLILVMSAIGGAWFPVFILPSIIQLLSKGSIVFWSIDGFLKVLWRQSSFTEIVPNILVLFGIGTTINIFSLYRFRQGKVI